AAHDNDTPWTAKYDDGNVNPLYCFGHGLSYTTFEYSDLTVEKHDDYADISVKIKNTGKYDGYEVAQLYIHDMFASRVRPVRELKGYKKVFIKSGEETTVTIKLPFDELKFYNQKLEKVLESGDFEIFVGTDSAAKLKGMLTI
ncbi:MAG: fibronectin type III-like domain-contianing protein, partial [Acutalibacteraceae bacterium]|nr:fibronectin type III-like domain-contianing protein [Acutalibacteraceae bacterium]